MLSEYGYQGAADCLEDFLTVIQPFEKSKRIPTETEIENMEKISDRFLDELPLDVIDEIAVKVAELLKKSKC